MKKQASLNQSIPNPSELMRARHPDLFSDTLVSDSPRIAKAVFEYHLDTLTNRKQEYEFEHFCRKLAEKEICPNLRVQTGPTGGGDSKVDTETYPVAKEIAERWWVGTPDAGTERWAFAFSAKKAWKQKIKSDVDSILSTGRDYKRIFFFTNQFVRDKERSSQEDMLSKYAGVAVDIFDRAWLVEKVYESGHFDLALSTLGIDDTHTERLHRPGPRDTARLAELEELDKQVADPSRYQGARYQLVEDCLRSAILARGLERPRNEVESRFAQADRLAQELNIRQQRLRIAYNQAWTAFWWYEDFSAFCHLYDEVEQRLEGSDQAGEVELLLNLWQLLSPSVAAGRLRVQEANIETRRQRLTAMLEFIAANPVRPNNALQARTGLVLIKIALDFQAGRLDLLEESWHALSQIVEESSALGSYPVTNLYDIIIIFGEKINSPGFDKLYEKVVDTIRQRRSEGEAGEAYIERGTQKFQQERPYEAIEWFGKAEELLIKEEYRAELVRALIESSLAYERVGLLWAARNKALVAVERTLAVFYEQGEMIPPTLIALNRLVWIELQLGRIPHAVGTIQLTRFAVSHLKLSGSRQKAYDEEQYMQDLVLGIHFLNLPLVALSDVERLPDALKRLGLTNARMALLFVLGYEHVLRNEGYIPSDATPDDVQTFFEQWHDQPATKDLPSQPMLVSGTTSLLKTTILGSELAIETQNNPISFGIAESVLGAFEALMATSDENDVIPHCEQKTIVVTASDHLASMPQLRFLENDGRLEIIHPTDFDFKASTEQHDFILSLKEWLFQIISCMLLIRDPKAWLEKFTGQGRAFSQALTLGDALTLDKNVFGKAPKLRLADWLEPTDQNYVLLRSAPWEAAKSAMPPIPEVPSEPLKFGSDPPPVGLFDMAQLKHTDRCIMSPINIPLWDRAKWHATAFFFIPPNLPGLAITFENGQAGQAIFQEWRTRWDGEDKEDELRLAVITGLSKQNPAEYAIIVGPNLPQRKNRQEKMFMLVSRIKRMTPNNSTNLDTFIAAYQRFGSFLLFPAQMKEGAPILFNQMAIKKWHFHIRQAWEIGENDPDAAALFDDDEPIIPAGISDPPIHKALEQMRAFRQAMQRQQHKLASFLK